ncbi:P-loop containing nucleoside triphosphate hydrolase protein [Thozetella sp. PMI_491]|nr:P-loop containing nucleoside triphosphate hydrolase protein [Thozetella sp. PMI_491]
MAKKFVPRQRKRKVLDRQRAAESSTRQTEQDDSNALEILPSQKDELEGKKAKLREELRPEGVKVTGKKAKRLEKYIDNKLRKDENRELLAQLAAQKIDTSLFASTRSLGQAKETKKETLKRALREKKANLALDGNPDDVLLRRRREVDEGAREDSDSDGESEEESDSDEGPDAPSKPTKEDVQPKTVAALTSTASGASSAIGSGLKRPLDVDDSGRPVLAKRQKRGGVKTKFSLAKPEPRDDEYSDWSGFSSDDEHAVGEPGGSSEDQDDGSGDESSEDDAESSGEEDLEGDDEYSEVDSRVKQKERSSAFLAWAHQQRNKASGYTPVESGPVVLDIPKPENFTPRPLEQDPLPRELQPTKNIARKVYSVAVTRDSEIDAARLKLPVVAEEHKIMEAIHNHNVVVIAGATGSGKTTQVPQFLFEAGYGSPGSPTPGMIGVTQPRRVAAVSMSKRVGQELGDHSEVSAYQIRFEGTVSPKTAIKFMTDGVLLREVAQDMALRKYSAIVIDEAHERSVNTDILVAILSRVVKLRAQMSEEEAGVSPLKLIIMSATLRIEDVAQNPRLFPTPPEVLEVEGRQHPVTVHFARRTQHDYVEEAFRKISRGHRKLPPGGFLVFLTGQNEIFQLTKRLKTAFGGLHSANGPKVRISASEAPLEVEDIEFGEADDRNTNDIDDEIVFGDDDDEEEEEDEFRIEDEEPGTGPLRMHILPLYSLLPTKEQMKVFEPSPDGSRQVILATNVAETSLTIPGIRYVFDCGRAKERKFDSVSGVQSFEIGWVSKASANQRSGRAGRTGPGHCYRLYSSAVYERDFPEFSDPELLRMPIEGVVLQLKAMNLQHVVNFPFPTPPSQSSLVKAEKLLTYLSAISAEGQVTQLGTTMSIFPLAPRYARILLVGHLHDCMPYTIALVAGLSAAEVFLQESQAIPAPPSQEDEDAIRTNEDVAAQKRRDQIRQAYGRVHKNFCFLDDKSDAIKLLQVVGEFAHEPTEEWCESHFVRYKVLKEITQLRHQIVDLLKTNIPAFANLKPQDKLDPPSRKQVQALKQMVAAGFIDQVAIRADKAPTPPEMARKPRRAIDVPYLPLIPLDSERQLEPNDRLVYIHPSSPMARLSAEECPEYVVYAYLQKAGNTGAEGEKKAKTRMHALTDITGVQLAALAKGTPLVTYGKPIKEVKGSEGEDGKGKTRDVWVIPYLKAEAVGTLGWPLPAVRVQQKKVPGKGWMVE